MINSRDFINTATFWYLDVSKEAGEQNITFQSRPRISKMAQLAKMVTDHLQMFFTIWQKIALYPTIFVI